MKTRLLGSFLLVATSASAGAQWSAVDHQVPLPAGHNWAFRARYSEADRLFNAFDYGHAILYEVMWTRPSAPTSVLESDQYEYITSKLLVKPPRLALEESAIAPDYSRLVPEAKAMFEWAHILHRQIYDVLADERLSESQRDAQVAKLVAYYRSRPDLAFSVKPKSMTLMEGQPYSLAFRKRYPKFNGLIWAYHWLQIGLYDALLAGTSPDERSGNVAVALGRFRQMLNNPPHSMPHVMPMTPAIAPLFTKRYADAAAIFDNLHSMHDVISDILANDAVPRDQKRAEILLAARRYRDDTTEVTTRADWIAMSESMGLASQGGPVVGPLTSSAAPTAGHAGHQMGTDTLRTLAEAIRGTEDAAARQRLLDGLFRVLEDQQVQQRLAADSSLRRVMLDLVPLIPEEHRDHYRMLIRLPPTPLRDPDPWQIVLMEHDHASHVPEHQHVHHHEPPTTMPAGRGEAAAEHDHAAHAGHDKHAGHSVAMFRDKFWWSLVLTLPTLVWGHMLQDALGFTPPHVPGAHWIPAIFGTAVFVYGGMPFLQGAVHELKDRQPGMMTLIALAISVAFLFSVAVLFGFPGMALWEEVATLVVIMLLGHWIEMKSITQAQGALQELAKLLPDRATRVEGEQLVEVAVSELRQDDLVLIRPGARVPADGAVTSGTSQVDESMLTGESKPVDKKAGDQVIAGTINLSGALRATITGTGDRTALAGIMRLVEQAQQSKSRAQALADRAAFFLTIVAIAAGALTLITWLLVRTGEPAFAIERMVTVLVIACPHALGLAVPLVIAISTTMGAQGGLLVRDRRGLEEARNLTTVVFDKTGTLTLGEHRVVDIATNAIAPDEALRLAAALERDSEHPVARAIVKSAEERSLDLPVASNFKYAAGRGVSGTINGREIAAGGPNLLSALNVEPDKILRDAAARAAEKGQGTIYLVRERSAIAAFAVADAIRPESREAIDRLHEEGIEVVMITGDAEPVARAVANELGIDDVMAQVLPEDKARRVQELQSRGKRVAMVGDGVNDAPALSTADVGVAIGAGTQVAVEAGDVVLIRSDPRDVPRIIRLSRATYRKMVQNLWWASGYNLIAIPLAAGVLASRGILLSPAVGAVLMSASTVIVALNAQLLRRQRI